MSDERETVEEETLPETGLVPCPTCGHPVEPRQLVCLSCGGRVALEHRRSIISEPIVPLIVALVVAGAGLFGFAISEITSGSGDDAGSSAQTPPAAPQVVDGEEQPARTEQSARTATQAERRPEPARPANPLAWPRGVTAHTVVLVTTGDRPAARAVAQEARSTGLEAGLLPSDPYDLGTGLWIVFSGRFTTREGAARQAAQLAGRYPGAYPQLVQRSQ